MNNNNVLLVARKPTQTMSSLEIAKLTSKEHSKVMADIKRVLGEAEIDDAVFRDIYLDSAKREQKSFNLPSRECDLIIAGYSVKYRLAIIDRWQELEAAQSKVPTNFIEAMQSAVDRGLLVQIEQTPHTDSKGTSHPAFQTRITGKGQVYFEKRYRVLEEA